MFRCIRVSLYDESVKNCQLNASAIYQQNGEYISDIESLYR